MKTFQTLPDYESFKAAYQLHWPVYTMWFIPTDIVQVAMCRAGDVFYSKPSRTRWSVGELYTLCLGLFKLHQDNAHPDSETARVQLSRIMQRLDMRILGVTGYTKPMK